MNRVKVKGRWYDLDDLKRRVDLRDILGTDVLFCPWHQDEQTPNLSVYQNHVYCFACGHWADGIEYLMELDGCSFQSAVVWLAEEAREHKTAIVNRREPKVVDAKLVESLNLTLYTSSWLGKELVWLKRRGIGLNEITRHLIGWTGHAYSIPHFVDGKCWNIKFRCGPGEETVQLNGHTKTRPKYWNLSGHPMTHPWPWDYFHSRWHDSKVVFVCEGEFDAMILLAAGLPAVSLPSGVNTHMSTWKDFWGSFNSVLLLFDQDEAGDKATTSSALQEIEKLLSNTGFLRLTWPREWGVDVTDARKLLIPRLKRIKEAYA